eukprot:jgi/Tetstr1/431162/TSEL_020874.t1
MKFGRLLRDASAELPEMESLFSCYKQLKKQLKRIHAGNHASSCDSISSDEQGGEADRSSGSLSSAAAQASARNAMPPPPPPAVANSRAREPVIEPPSAEEVKRSAAACAELTPEETGFLQALIENVQRFNDVFLEKEEQSIIHLRGLQDAKLGAPDSLDNLKCVYKEYVDLHGDLLLLMHWSVLAYTGLVKILKKHHKRTGLLLRAPFLSDLLAQPFCSTEGTAGLVRKAEDEISKLSREMRWLESGEADAAVDGVEDSAAAAEDGCSGRASAPTPGSAGEPSFAGPDKPSACTHAWHASGSVEAEGGLAGTKRPAPEEADAEELPAGTRRAQAALGTWRQLSETASTPSTVCMHASIREGTPITEVSGC